MELVIVRLGSSEYPEDKKDLFQFLTALFYPQESNLWETIGQYIDFSTNLELEKEADQMIGLGQSILEEGIRKGEVRGKAKGKAEDILDLLADIGVVSSELTRQIYAQQDEAQLRQWLKLAARAGSVEQFVEFM